MPIMDASIYSQVKPVQINDPLDTYGKAQALKMGDQTMAMNKMKLDATQREQAEDAMIEAAINTSLDPGTGQIDHKSVISKLQSTNPRAAMRYSAEVTKMNMATDEAQLKRMELVSKMTTEERAQAQKNAEMLNKTTAWIKSQPDPSKAWDMAVTTMGAPKLAGQYSTELLDLYAQMGAKLDESLKGQSPVGKLAADLKAGLISQDAYNAALKKETTHAPGTQVNVNATQEKEESKAVGKGFGESYVEIQKAGISAQAKLSRYGRMEQLLQGVTTGKFTPTKTQIAAIADGLGITIDPNLGEKQALEALSNEVALTLRSPSGGAGMPGALSDKDREFLVGMTPGLGKTVQGNQLIINTAKLLAKRDQEVAQIARNYRKAHGTLDEGFYDELAAFSEAHPMFSGGAKTNSAPSRQPTGPTATGPNGEKIMWNGKSWVPVS